MIKITDKNLIGVTLINLNGTETQVTVEEASGAITIGKVIGYSKGGHNALNSEEPEKASVLIRVTDQEDRAPGDYRILIEDIVSLSYEI